jgi:hypothetical protein
MEHMGHGGGPWWNIEPMGHMQDVAIVGGWRMMDYLIFYKKVCSKSSLLLNPEII